MLYHWFYKANLQLQSACQVLVDLHNVKPLRT